MTHVPSEAKLRPLTQESGEAAPTTLASYAPKVVTADASPRPTVNTGAWRRGASLIRCGKIRSTRTRMLARLLPWVVVLATVGCNSSGTIPCLSNEALCTDRSGLRSCIDVSSDPDHCGACFSLCLGGGACVDGVCAPVCRMVPTNCGAGVIDPCSDPYNCGQCWNECASRRCDGLGNCL